jgi:hypothetical protein
VGFILKALLITALIHGECAGGTFISAVPAVQLPRDTYTIAYTAGNLQHWLPLTLVFQ